MPQLPGKFSIAILMIVVSSALCFGGGNALAAANSAVCPFCSAVALTLTQQINEKEVVVIAKLVTAPEPATADSVDYPDGKFEIVGVIKGEKLVEPGMTFLTQLVGVYPVGQKFMVMGQGPPDIAWTTPLQVSKRVTAYLNSLFGLPESGPERLVFFQDYFEDSEPSLAFDAYDEFAAAPYEDLIAMKDSMRREQLIEFIKSRKTTVDRRRLYLTMLGVCGTDEDALILEEFLTSDDARQRAGLDALVGCYLNLKGKAGLQLIQQRFLQDADADFQEVSQVVDALRFHATETDVIATKDIVPVVRVLLDHPEHADIVIEDLARWEDWSVVDKLVGMFKSAEKDGNWQRVPIITYLRACPKPEAAQYIEELRKIDPAAVQRADFYLGIGDSDDDWNDSPSDSKPNTDKAEPPSSKDESAQKNTPETSSSRVIVDSGVVMASLDNPVTLASAGETEVTNAGLVETKPPAEETAAATTGKPADNVKVAAAAASVSGTSYRPASLGTSWGLLAKVILIPMAASFLILGLMWSVVNGWFERLIF